MFALGGADSFAVMLLICVAYSIGTTPLAALGYGRDPRLANAMALVLQKQDAQGRWKLEHKYYNKVWVDFGRGGQPNKWITLRALRALKAAG